MGSISEILVSCFQRYIHLVFYTISSCLVYFYLLRPVFNTLYPIYYYHRFHCLPRNVLFGNLIRLMPNFPIPSPPEEICRNADTVIDELIDSNKDRSVSVLWLGPFPLVYVSNHEAIEAVMTRSNVDKPFFYRFIPLRNGLVTSKAALWKIRRKAIEPFYVTKKMKRYVNIMNEEIESFPKLLAQWVGKPVDIEHSIHASSLNVILKVSASIPLADLPETKRTIIDVIDKFEQLIYKRIMYPIYWFDSMFKFFKDGQLYYQQFDKIPQLVETVINHRHQVINSSPSSSNNHDHDLISILEPQLNTDGIIEEFMTTVMAGHETVSLSLRWTLFLLGNHADIQERVYREIIGYFPDDEPVNDLDKLNQCAYLEQCLKESLRLFPSVHSVGRVLTEDVVIKDKKLLKGTSFLVCIKTTHRDPSVYPDPLKYDPERWNPENIKSIPKAAFIPFSHGPRNCIGYRYGMIILKVYLVHILRKFSLQSTQKEGTIRLRCEIACKADSPLEIIFSSRNNHENESTN